ncbi:DoxX family membrane protein [Actinomadura sp. 9N407]|uniref:DoxX family protein n=1 Tax=Actinomadura sp. 9N407 TaxID=3375154 RepID=UPI0037B0A84D
MRSRPLYDVVALLARLGAGIVFMAHGWQKIEAGITATGRSFDTLGVPLPTGAAVYAAFVELLGGAALIAGLGLPVVGVLLFVDMAGAFVFVHVGNGLFLVDGERVGNGYELVLVLGLTSLLFAAGAGGRLTLDQWLFGARRRGPAEDEEDERSFVESLREAENKPAAKPAAGPATRPSGSSGSSGSPAGTAGRAAGSPAAKPDEKPAPKKQPAKPPAPTMPEAAAAPGGQGERPRLASGIVEGEADDTLVAGRRKPGRRRRGSSDTQPIKRDEGTGG